MYRVVDALERLTTSVGYMAAVIILPLALATCYDVFARYVLLEPTIWAFELGYSLMGAHFLLGAAITLKLNHHVRIDLLYATFNPKARATIDLVLYLFILLPFLVLLTYALYDYTANALVSGERTGQSAWNPPIWPLRAIITLSMALLGIQVLAEILKSAMILFGGSPAGAPAERS